MLSDEEFKTGVENCGGQVRAFNQDQMVDKRAYMDDGACGQIAAVWIRNGKFRASGKQVPNAETSLDEISWMCEQKNRGRDAIDEFLMGNGLIRDSGRIIFTVNINLDTVSTFILAQAAYYLVGIVNDLSGHGIAFSTVTVPSLFDPNYGEARFHTPQGLKRLFKAYWPRAYADLNGQGFVQRYR